MMVRLKNDVLCHATLTPGKAYEVVGLDDEFFRVVDDRGDPVLFPRNEFSIIDENVPDDWIWERFSDDEFYADPPELHAPGFYEDYFEGKEYARRQFQAYLQRLGKHV